MSRISSNKDAHIAHELAKFEDNAKTIQVTKAAASCEAIKKIYRHKNF